LLKTAEFIMPIFDLHAVVIIFEVALVGGILGLDRTAAGQFMISQPIVAGPLTGWMLGDTAAGLVIGAILELIWVLDMPVGAFLPADSTIGAISATAVAALGSAGNATPDLIGFSILLTTATVPITMKVEGAVRTYNSRYADRAASAAGEDADRKLSRAHLSGLAVFFLKSFVLYLVFVPAGLIAVSLLIHLPLIVHRALAMFVKLLPLLGAALVVRKLSIRNLDRFFLAGFVVAAVMMLVLHAHAWIVVFSVAAAGYAEVRYSERRL
jgi:mannose/fructose/N-acetylgalactosamine-specific phosphotransferase system component IIC